MSSSPFIVLHLRSDKSEIRVNIDRIFCYWWDSDRGEPTTVLSFGLDRHNKIEVAETPEQVDAIVEKRGEKN